MARRRYVQRKKGSKKEEQPFVTTQLAPEQTAQHHRSVHNPVPLGTQVDHAEHFGHNLGQMSIMRSATQHQTSPNPTMVQRQEDDTSNPSTQLSGTAHHVVLQRARTFDANGYDEDGYNEQGYDAGRQYDAEHDKLFHYDDVTTTSSFGQVSSDNLMGMTSQQVMHDPRFLDKFEDFTGTEFSRENVEFVKAVKQFKTKYPSMRTENSLQANQAAVDIYDMYIKEDASAGMFGALAGNSRGINISSGERVRVENELMNNPVPFVDRDLHQLFDPTVSEINRLVHDTLSRYRSEDANGLEASMASASTGHGLAKNIGHFNADQEGVRNDFVNRFRSPFGKLMATGAISTPLGNSIMSMAGMKRSWDNRKARNAARTQRDQTRARSRSDAMPDLLKDRD